MIHAMFDMIVSGAMIGVLLTVLAVLRHRERRNAPAITPTASIAELTDEPQSGCRVCKDQAVATCPRCEYPLCEIHRPWKPELACLACEAEWERGGRARTLALAPFALIGLVVGCGILVILGIVGSALGFHAHGSVGIVVVIFGAPIMVAIGTAGYVDRKTFRRRFMRARRTRLPRSTVVDRR